MSNLQDLKDYRLRLYPIVDYIFIHSRDIKRQNKHT